LPTGDRDARHQHYDATEQQGGAADERLRPSECRQQPGQRNDRYDAASRAARNLGVTASSVTRLIDLLEASLGSKCDD